MEGLSVVIAGSQTSPIVMNHPIHKIAYVSDQGSSAVFIIKRPGGAGKFKCHLFDLASNKQVDALLDSLLLSLISHCAFVHAGHCLSQGDSEDLQRGVLQGRFGFFH